MLRKCLKSCLEQTYRNIEVVIVDDGSTDDTPKVVSEFQAKDPRIKYLKKKNSGLPRALNSGFKICRGHFLTWTSDDNYYSNDAIEKMLETIIQKNCSFVYCNYYKFDKMTPDKIIVMNLPNSSELNQRNIIGACFLYSREVWETIGDYDPDAYLAEDYDYWIRISRQFSICHISEPLYYYMSHDESLSEKFTKELEVEFVALLVKLKNNCLNADSAKSLFIKLISGYNPPIRVEKSNLNKILNFFSNTILFFFYCWIKIIYRKKISMIFTNFKVRGLSIQVTKNILKNISNQVLRIRKISWIINFLRLINQNIINKSDAKTSKNIKANNKSMEKRS